MYIREGGKDQSLLKEQVSSWRCWVVIKILDDLSTRTQWVRPMPGPLPLVSLEESCQFLSSLTFDAGLVELTLLKKSR